MQKDKQRSTKQSRNLYTLHTTTSNQDWVRVMVFNTVSTIFQLYHGSQFYWWKETGVSGENHLTVANHWQTYHIMLYWVHYAMSGIQPPNFNGDRHWLHR